MEKIDDNRAQAEKVLAELLEMKGSMPEAVWSKCMIAISWEWFVDDDMEEGFRILNRVRPEYFKSILRPDMAEDTDFACIVRLIAGKIVEANIVSLEPPMRPTQAPAKA